MIDQDLFKAKPASEFKVGDTLTWHCPTDGGGFRIGVLLEVCENSVRMFVSGTFGKTDLRLNEVVPTDNVGLLFSIARPEHFGYLSGLLMGAGFEYPQADDKGTMVLIAYGADADDGDCDCEECDRAESDRAESDRAESDRAESDRAESECEDVLTPIIRAGIHSHPIATLDACLESGMDVTPTDVVEELGTEADEVPVLIRQIVDFDEDGTVTADCTPLLEYADDGSSGMDIRAVIRSGDESGYEFRKGIDVPDSYIDIPAGGRRLIHTNLYAACPKGYELQVRPRSGLALKHGITVLNTPGTIDSSYRGEVGVILINHGTESFRVFAGDRIAQLVLAPIAVCKWYKVGELPTSDRDGGFGHTGVE